MSGVILVSDSFGCCVPFCSNRSTPTATTAFVRFPANAKRRKDWCDALHVNFESWKVDDLICEAHFSENMFSITVNKRLQTWARPNRVMTSAGVLTSVIPKQQANDNDDDESQANTERISLKIEKIEQPLVFKCDICNEDFETRVARNDHINTHFKVYQCQHCAQQFVGDRQYQHHQRQCASNQRTAIVTVDPGLGVKVYECYICHKSNILVLRSLKVHMNRSHPTIVRPAKPKYRCKICQRVFANIYIYKSHMAEIHTKTKQFQCTTCDKTFNRLSNLKMHRLIHENKMPCKCQFCGKSFRTMSGVNLHVRTHTGAKPYHCNICNEKSYAYNTDLKRHQRSAHGIVDRIFACESCDQVFYEPKFLRRHHEKVHAISSS